MSIARRADGKVFISQPAYVEKLLKNAEMEITKPARTPMSVSGIILREKDAFRVNKTNYLRLVGGINYLAYYTRSDLLYALSSVAQACSSPKNSDLRRVKRILQYIYFTKNEGILFNCDNDYNLICYVDASFNCYDDGKGHYGYTFSLGKNNGHFYSKSSKMKIVTLSSTEAEYVALAHAVTEIVYLRRLLKEIGFQQFGPTRVYEDNLSCIKIVEGELNHKTTKHISIRYHYSKQELKRNTICLRHIKTEKMIADILTKPLPVRQHVYLTKRILRG